MTGRYAQLEPLNAEAHAALLFRAFEGQDQLCLLYTSDAADE